MSRRIYTQTFGVVAALLEKDGKFLLVREAKVTKPDIGKWNHPAGWLEVGEDPVEAVKREVLEETGYAFEPTHLLGVYSLVRKDLESAMGSPLHPVKLVFLGRLDETSRAALAEDVSETRWFAPEEIEAMGGAELRDADIKTMVQHHREGRRWPLELLTHGVQA